MLLVASGRGLARRGIKDCRQIGSSHALGPTFMGAGKMPCCAGCALRVGGTQEAPDTSWLRAWKANIGRRAIKYRVYIWSGGYRGRSAAGWYAGQTHQQAAFTNNAPAIMRTGEEMDLHVYMSKRKSLKRCTCTYKLTHVHVYLQTIPFTSNYNKGMIIITEYTLMNCTKKHNLTFPLL